MLDVVTSLRMLEQKAESAVQGGADTAACVDLGVEARNLGVLLGTARLPAMAESSVRERAMLLTHHGEALARAALQRSEIGRIRELMQEVEMDTHLLRGALESTRFDPRA